ncbi:MAG TPA: DUF1631 domain-containing protein [Pseudomonadales bacterium]
MSNPKVVSLQSGRKPSSALPPIVGSVRQQARKQLAALVKDLLNGTDDALFEMADRSQSNADHNLYFDSMRQIRLHRGEVEKRFGEELSEGFDRAFSEDALPDSIDQVEADEIGLVENDDLEISVAISGIVSKITSQFSLPIMELTKRFDHLSRHSSINERRNPLGPQMVGEAFARAIECLDLDIKIRIILLKLFERLVMQRMGPVYDAANRMLIEAGVLQDLRRTLGRGRNPAAAARRPGQPPGANAAGPGGFGVGGGPAAGNAGGEYAGAPGAGGYGGGHGGLLGAADAAGSGYGGGFSTIQSLLAGLRPPGDEVPAGGAIIGTPVLIDLLDEVQVETGGERLDIEHLPPRVDLRHLVVTRAPDVTGQAMNHLGRADEDVVNFIGLLFDYILNDRNLAIPMKALIGRLQIPIVKLAILDKSFFDSSAHPARQLLNELSSAGIGWSSAAELKRDVVYDKIESIVIRVLNGFRDNPQIFQDLLEELREFRAQDTVRNARMEQRVKEKESGRARTLAAKEDVQKVINQKACGLRLPRELGRFLSDVWSRVMVYVTLREGQTSAAWEALISVLDDLLWALQPLDDMDQIERRDALADALLDRLRAGMALIQLPDSDQDHWCTVIGEQIAEVSRNDRMFLEDDDVPRSVDAFPEMEEIVLAAPHEVTDSYQGEAPAPAFVEKINRLTEGTWVEIHQEGESVLRCKLATIVRPGDRYVFVNRRGMKVAEKTRMELARELQDDKLVVLNDSQVFDRALQAVIGNLRQIQRQGV